MHRIPRDISGRELAGLLNKYGYIIVLQTSSSRFKHKEHKITIPDHQVIKIGTLNNILNEVAEYLKKSKQDLIKDLFNQ